LSGEGRQPVDAGRGGAAHLGVAAAAALLHRGVRPHPACLPTNRRAPSPAGGRPGGSAPPARVTQTPGPSSRA
jgi:hypothetical protein